MLVRKRKECEELREMLLELNNRADHEARLRALAEEDARSLREQVRYLEGLRGDSTSQLRSAAGQPSSHQKRADSEEAEGALSAVMEEL